MKFLKILLVLLLLGGALYGFYSYQSRPFGSGGNVYISKGASVAQVADLLQQSGILQNRWVFLSLARLHRLHAVLKPGEYEFGPQLRPQEVLEKLLRGDRVVRKLVIPEGFSFVQIAAALEKAGIAPVAEVYRYYRDPAWLNRLGFPAPSLEGFLFPATYPYDRGTKLEEILGQMVKAFQQQFRGELRDQAMALGWTIPQVVTLASIIEKETGRKEERATISSVFHNRLRLGMPLQSDPTVIFGLPQFDGNLRKTDLLNPHPYNTYVHGGLPPGPIASPGKASLEAALRPASTQYLYFVGKGNGTHQFSTTLEEHEAAVAQYQLGRPLESRPTAETQPARP
jgi:conserved hypothetical protein, YceG family